MIGLIAGGFWILALTVPAALLLRPWRQADQVLAGFCALATTVVAGAAMVALGQQLDGGAPVFTEIPALLVAGPPVALMIDPAAAIGLLVIGGIGCCCSVHAMGAAPQRAWRATDHRPRRRVGFLACGVLLACLMVLARAPAVVMLAWTGAVACWLVLYGVRRQGRAWRVLRWLWVAAAAGLALLGLAMHFGPDGPKAQYAPGGTEALLVGLAFVGWLSIALALGHAARRTVAIDRIPVVVLGVLMPVAASLVAVRWLLDLALHAAPGAAQASVGAALLCAGGFCAAVAARRAFHTQRDEEVWPVAAVAGFSLAALALGLGLVFRAHGLASLASLAVTAALFQIAATAVAAAAAGLARDAGCWMSARRRPGLRGQFRLMPFTGVVALVAAAAQACLPLLIGFPGLWLSFQAVLSLGATGSVVFAVLMPVLLGVLVLVPGTLLVALAREWATQQLGLPRHRIGGGIQDGDWPMIAALVLLCALCVLPAIAPGAVAAVFEISALRVAGLSDLADVAVGESPLLLRPAELGGGLGPAIAGQAIPGGGYAPLVLLGLAVPLVLALRLVLVAGVPGLLAGAPRDRIVVAGAAAEIGVRQVSRGQRRARSRKGPSEPLPDTLRSWLSGGDESGDGAAATAGSGTGDD